MLRSFSLTPYPPSILRNPLPVEREQPVRRQYRFQEPTDKAQRRLFDGCPITSSRKPCRCRPANQRVGFENRNSLHCFFDAASNFRDFMLQKVIYDRVEIAGSLVSQFDYRHCLIEIVSRFRAACENLEATARTRICATDEATHAHGLVMRPSPREQADTSRRERLGMGSWSFGPTDFYTASAELGRRSRLDGRLRCLSGAAVCCTHTAVLKRLLMEPVRFLCSEYGQSGGSRHRTDKTYAVEFVP